MTNTNGTLTENYSNITRENNLYQLGVYCRQSSDTITAWEIVLLVKTPQTHLYIV